MFDQAQQALQTAQAQVDDAEAQLDIAQDRVSFTELKADVAGSITARSAEAGEVVQAGQTIFTGRPRRTAATRCSTCRRRCSAPRRRTRRSRSRSTDDPSVTAKARVREVDPQADPVTRTFRVRVGLIDPPPAMRLGATVTGTPRARGAARASRFRPAR